MDDSARKKREAIDRLKKIAHSQKSFLPKQAEHLSSALLCEYLDIFTELGLVDIVDQVTAKNRTQGITPGQHLLFCVLNRLTSPTSTNQLQDWFDTTLLTELYPEAQQFLTPQNIWNNFKYLNDAHLQEIFFQLTQKVLQTQGNSLNTILFDSTNFYTYINDHPQNSIPKRGTVRIRRIT